MEKPIVIIGEAWGEHEARQRRPFVGPAGYELHRMLAEAGIDKGSCHLTNVFNLQPRGNKIETLCGGKEGGVVGYPGLLAGKYVRREFQVELDRLGDELMAVNPNLIIAMGNTPLWALCGRTGISKLRGTTLSTTHVVEGFKLLPTFHPAYILRQWEDRPTAIADLQKARVEAEFSEIRRPNRQIWIEPTLEDLHVFRDRHIRGAEILSIDIETAGDQVTCIGFAPNPQLGLVVPFVDYRRPNRCYWPTQADERAAWHFVAEIAEDGGQRKLFQNGLYDIAFLWRACGIRVREAEEDTMLLHHALQPEAQKALGFLGSVYCNDVAWKVMRKRGKTTIKGEDE